MLGERIRIIDKYTWEHKTSEFDSPVGILHIQEKETSDLQIHGEWEQRRIAKKKIYFVRLDGSSFSALKEK